MKRHLTRDTEFEFNYGDGYVVTENNRLYY